MINRQVEMGEIDADSLTENFQNESVAYWIIRQYSFWLELILMLIIPLPFASMFNN